MDVDRLHDLFLFALVTAGEAPRAAARELGPIHLLKYAYVGDAAWAAAHDGESWTGISWEFGHFGPWHAGAARLVSPIVRQAGATARVVEPTHEGPRYTLVNPERLTTLAATVPLDVRRAVKDAVRRFAGDTVGLLEHVYHTRPMLDAAPGETLDLRSAGRVPDDTTPPEDLTARERKKRREALDDLGVALRARVAARRARVTPDAPRYDAVYAEGLRWLESLAAGPGVSAGALTVDDSVWHSDARTHDG